MSTWWRGMASLMAACLVVLLAASPALDALICHDEALPFASSSAALAPADGAQMLEAASDKGDAAPAGAAHGSDAGDACPHGHCHHFSVFAPDEPLRPFRTAFLEIRNDDLRQRVPPSLPGSTPERPPRA